MGVHWDTQHLGCDSVGIIIQRSISPNTISCVPKDENMVTNLFQKVHTQYFREIGPIVKIIVCTSAYFFFLELGLVSAFTTESIAKFISTHCL